MFQFICVTCKEKSSAPSWILLLNHGKCHVFQNLKRNHVAIGETQGLVEAVNRFVQETTKNVSLDIVSWV